MTFCVRYLSHNLAAWESFPSGDTGGAASFAATLSLFTAHMGASAKVWQNLAYTCVVITGFGRMYFHAHHFFDVCFGAMIGKLLPGVVHFFVRFVAGQ